MLDLSEYNWINYLRRLSTWDLARLSTIMARYRMRINPGWTYCHFSVDVNDFLYMFNASGDPNEEKTKEALILFNFFKVPPNNRVDCLQIFAGIAIFCVKERIEKRIDYIFDLFNFGGTGHLVEDEVIMICECLTSVFGLLDLIKQPTTREIEFFVAKLFTPTTLVDTEPTINKSDFRKWIITSPSTNNILHITDMIRRIDVLLETLEKRTEDLAIYIQNIAQEELAAMARRRSSTVNLEDTIISEDGMGKRKKVDPNLDYLTFKSLKLTSNASVRVLTGPVIGKVLHNMAFILLEVDTPQVVSIHLTEILSNKSSDAPVQILTFDGQFQARKPFIYSITDLKPSTSYLFAFSGVHRDDTISRIGCFKTAPSPGAFISDISIVAVSQDRPADLVAGSECLWDLLCERIIKPETNEPLLDILLHLGGQVYFENQVIANAKIVAALFYRKRQKALDIGKKNSSFVDVQEVLNSIINTIVSSLKDIVEKPENAETIIYDIISNIVGVVAGEKKISEIRIPMLKASPLNIEDASPVNMKESIGRKSSVGVPLPPLPTKQIDKLPPDPDVLEMEEQILDLFRNVYRSFWSFPGIREVLATGSHLMNLSDKDLIPNYEKKANNNLEILTKSEARVMTLEATAIKEKLDSENKVKKERLELDNKAAKMEEEINIKLIKELADIDVKLSQEKVNVDIKLKGSVIEVFDKMKDVDGIEKDKQTEKLIQELELGAKLTIELLVKTSIKEKQLLESKAKNDKDELHEKVKRDKEFAFVKAQPSREKVLLDARNIKEAKNALEIIKREIEIDTVILRLARQVYWEYQRSLWDPEILTSIKEGTTDKKAGEVHFHVWGSAGFIFLDLRSNRLKVDGTCDKSKTLIGSEQMNYVKRCLKTPNLRSLFVITEYPLILEKSKSAALHLQDGEFSDLSFFVSDMKEYEPILKVFSSWKAADNTSRSLQFVCGGIKCGAKSDCEYISMKSKFSQIIVGPMTATARTFFASPPSGVVGSEKTGFSYTHSKISNSESRNFASIRVNFTPKVSSIMSTHVMPLSSKPRIIVGPIIGKVTSSSVIILLEINTSAVVTCVIIEALTKKSKKIVKSFVGKRPSTFLIEGLVPGQKYLVAFEGVENSKERPGDFTTMLHNPLAFNLFVVSGDDPTCCKASDANIWDWIKMKLRSAWTRSLKLPPSLEPRLGADLMLHIGGQAAMIHEFQTATSWIEQHLLSENSSSKSSEILENEAKEHLRRVYRTQWNMPELRHILATGSHLMMWSDDDLISGLSHLPSVNPTTLRLVREVYREYQRPLWDPEPNPADTKEYHFHRWGNTGILFIDMRGNRFGKNGERLPREEMLGEVQKSFIDRSLQTTGLKVLLVVSEFPIVADSLTRVRNFSSLNPKGSQQWAFNDDDHAWIIKLLTSWVKRKSNRALYLISGNLGCGLESNIYDDDIKFDQMAIGPITGKLLGDSTILSSPSFESLPEVERYSAIGFNAICFPDGSINSNLFFKHKAIFGHRNYGILNVSIGDNESSVVGSIIGTHLSGYATAIVGPVLGRVTSTSAIVLLEVDCVGPITCIFESVVDRSVFVEKKVNMPSWKPKSFLVTGLSPATSYEIFFRGITNSVSRRGFIVTPSLNPTRFRIAAFSGFHPENFPNDEKSPFELIKKLTQPPNPQVNLVIHLGGQVPVIKALGDEEMKTLKIRETLGLTDAERLEMEESMRDRIRDLYRATWNFPGIKEILSCCSNLMIRGEGDLCEGFCDSTCEISAMQLRLGREVWEEYQQQLWRVNDDEGSEDISSGWSTETEFLVFHQWDQFGVLQVDMRGNKLNYDGTRDFQRPLFSDAQWSFIAKSVSSAEGMIVLVVVLELPIAVEDKWFTEQRMKNKVFSFLRDSWAYLELDAIRLLKLLFSWKADGFARSEFREVQLICGGHGFALTSILKEMATNITLTQTVTCPITNKGFLSFPSSSGPIFYNQFEYRHLFTTQPHERGFSFVDMFCFQSTASLTSNVIGYDKSLPIVTVGPVIGKVTHDSAIILIEISQSTQVTVVLFEISTGIASSKTHFLREGKPKAFYFENLYPERRYAVKVEGTFNSASRMGSFITPHASPSSFNVASISGNDPEKLEYGASSAWRLLHDRLKVPFPKIDMLLHLGGQVNVKVAFDQATIWLEREQERNRQDSIILNELEHDEMLNKFKERIREVYRTSWNTPGVQEVLANIPNLMIVGDLDIYPSYNRVDSDIQLSDGTGFKLRGCEATNLQALKLTREVALEYTRQLWDKDLLDEDGVITLPQKNINEDFHFECFGSVGIFFLDCRSSRVNLNEKTYFSEKGIVSAGQIQYLKNMLSSAAGQEMKTLIVCSEVPLALDTLEHMRNKFEATNDPQSLAYMYNQWVYSNTELNEVLTSLFAWQDSTEQRKVVLLSGNMGNGLQTVIRKKANNLRFIQQIILGPCSDAIKLMPYKQTGDIGDEFQYEHSSTDMEAFLKDIEKINKIKIVKKGEKPTIYNLPGEGRCFALVKTISKTADVNWTCMSCQGGICQRQYTANCSCGHPMSVHESKRTPPSHKVIAFLVNNANQWVTDPPNGSYEMWQWIQEGIDRFENWKGVLFQSEWTDETVTKSEEYLKVLISEISTPAFQEHVNAMEMDIIKGNDVVTISAEARRNIILKIYNTVLSPESKSRLSYIQDPFIMEKVWLRLKSFTTAPLLLCVRKALREAGVLSMVARRIAEIEKKRLAVNKRLKRISNIQPVLIKQEEVESLSDSKRVKLLMQMASNEEMVAVLKEIIVIHAPFNQEDFNKWKIKRDEQLAVSKNESIKKPEDVVSKENEEDKNMNDEENEDFKKDKDEEKRVGGDSNKNEGEKKNVENLEIGEKDFIQKNQNNESENKEKEEKDINKEEKNINNENGNFVKKDEKNPQNSNKKVDSSKIEEINNKKDSNEKEEDSNKKEDGNKRIEKKIASNELVVLKESEVKDNNTESLRDVKAQIEEASNPEEELRPKTPKSRMQMLREKAEEEERKRIEAEELAKLDYATLEKRNFAIENLKIAEENKKFLPPSLSKDFFEYLSSDVSTCILLDLALVSDIADKAIVEAIFQKVKLVNKGDKKGEDGDGASKKKTRGRKKKDEDDEVKEGEVLDPVKVAERLAKEEETKKKKEERAKARSEKKLKGL